MTGLSHRQLETTKMVSSLIEIEDKEDAQATIRCSGVLLGRSSTNPCSSDMGFPGGKFPFWWLASTWTRELNAPLSLFYSNRRDVHLLGKLSIFINSSRQLLPQVITFHLHRVLRCIMAARKQTFGNLNPWSEPAWYNVLSSPYYNNSHRKLREVIRTYIDEKILPYAEEWEEEGAVPKEVRSQLPGRM